MQTLVGGKTWPWLPVVCRTLPQGNGHKEGWADARASQELEWGAGDWLAVAQGTIWASVSGLLLPILSSGFDHHGRDYKMAGTQVGKWGPAVQPAHQRKGLGFKRKAVLNPQVLTGTLRRHQHPQGDPHFGLPATQGHLSLPKAPACLWGLLPSFRSLSLRDCALQTTAQQKKKILRFVQSKLLLWNPTRD